MAFFFSHIKKRAAEWSRRMDYPSNRDLEAVITSWAWFTGKELQFGISFYKRLLRTEPLLKAYFKRDIEDHAHQLVDVLVILINNLDKRDYLIDHLRELGFRHKAYGVQPEHYAIVCDCLIFSLREFAGPRWNERAEQGWISMLRWVSKTMLDGSQ